MIHFGNISRSSTKKISILQTKLVTELNGGQLYRIPKNCKAIQFKGFILGVDTAVTFIKFASDEAAVEYASNPTGTPDTMEIFLDREATTKPKPKPVVDLIINYEKGFNYLYVESFDLTKIAFLV